MQGLKQGLLYDDYKLVHFSALSIVDDADLLAKVDNMDLPVEITNYFLCRDIHKDGLSCRKCSIINVMRYTRLSYNRSSYLNAYMHTSIITDNVLYMSHLNKHNLRCIRIPLADEYVYEYGYGRNSIMVVSFVNGVIYYNANKILRYLLDVMNITLTATNIKMAVFSNNEWVLNYCYEHNIDIWSMLSSCKACHLINSVTNVKALEALIKLIDIQKFNLKYILQEYNTIALEFIFNNGYVLSDVDKTTIAISSYDRYLHRYMVYNGFPEL